MKLKKVWVKNFKCVEDSTEFTIKDLTCLVGKNESGKTALLEALYLLNPQDTNEKFDKDSQYPRRFLADFDSRHPDGEAEVVSTSWELEKTDLECISDLGDKCLKNHLISISKGYSNVQNWEIGCDEQAVVNFLVDSNFKTPEAKLPAKKSTLKELKTYLEEKEDKGETTKLLLQSVDKILENGTLTNHISKRLSDKLPKFLYFSTYDEMDGKIQLEDLNSRIANKQITKNDKVFLAFLALAGIKPAELVKIDKYEPLNNKLEAASNKITSETFKFWTQNQHLKVHVELTEGRGGDPAPFNKGHIVRVRVYNEHHQVTVGLEARSAGFVWFFSFLSLFSQVKKQHGNIFILLDEPGLRLHGKAQYDLLRYIRERLEPHHQIIYTTHSPFMVDAGDLMSVRTVEDVIIDREGLTQVFGTKVGDDVLSRDKDTLFPLQGALGYEISQSLFIGKNTLLVEGPSDLLYLKCFQDELKRKGKETLSYDWTICPTGGIDKIMPFMILFSGNNLNVAVITDYAQGAKGRVESLRRSEILESSRVLTANSYARQAEADIEDIIGREAYITLVNKAYGFTGSRAIPTDKSTDTPIRVVEEVKQRFAVMPPNSPNFDHYVPASYLIENRSLLSSLPDIDKSIRRFEKLFKDLNNFIPSLSQQGIVSKNATV